MRVCAAWPNWRGSCEATRRGGVCAGRAGVAKERSCVMLPLTAAAGALSYLTSFLQSSTASNGASSTSSDPLLSLEQTLTAGADGDQSTTSAATSSGTSSPSFDPGMLAALLAMQSQADGAAGGTGSSDLLSKLDTDSDGQISKAEFENALGSAGVDTS